MPLNYSRPGRGWLVTNRLETGKSLTFFTVYRVLTPQPAVLLPSVLYASPFLNSIGLMDRIPILGRLNDRPECVYVVGDVGNDHWPLHCIASMSTICGYEWLLTECVRCVCVCVTWKPPGLQPEAECGEHIPPHTGNGGGGEGTAACCPCSKQNNIKTKGAT
jgi:hypothetical protein